MSPMTSVIMPAIIAPPCMSCSRNDAIANAATNTGAAAGVAGKAAGGSAIGGLVGVAAIGAGLAWAAHERRGNENIRGSANAVEQAAEQTEGLKDAFVAYVEAQREMSDMLSSGNINGPEFEQAAINADKATNALMQLEGAEDVLDKYSAWRQENALGNMDWVIPDNLDEFTGLMDNVVSDAQSTADVMPEIGGNISAGVAQGIYDRGGEAVEAANWLANAVSGALRSVLQIQSPSRVMMALGEYVSQGFAEGIENNISDVERATSRMVAATTSKPVEMPGSAGGAEGGGKMVHVTLVMDGQEVADIITPYVDSNIGATVARRR